MSNVIIFNIVQCAICTCTPFRWVGQRWSTSPHSVIWGFESLKIPGFYEIKICFLPMLRYFLFRKSRESSSNHKEIPDLLLLRNNLFRENEHNLECIYHATCSSSEQDIWICCRFIIFWDMCRLKSQRVGEYAEKFALKDWASERILCLKLFIKTIRG